MLEVAAPAKGSTVNCGQTFGENNIFQRGTISKCITANTGYSFSENDLFDTSGSQICIIDPSRVIAVGHRHHDGDLS